MIGHDVRATVSRNERRIRLRAEAKARATGNWTSWEVIDLPRGVPGMRGWAAEVRHVYRNNVFSVLHRSLPGGVIHLAVSSLSEIRPTWHEMQRIKDEIAGEDATAVEVYPPRDQIVDGANMFHIWVVHPLGFGLHDGGRHG